MNWNAYHFTGNRLRDGSPIPPVGETLVFAGEPILCRRGYHASRKPWQALQYASGEMLHRVHMGGVIIEPAGEGKLVATERTIIASIDATALLREYARKCALDVIHLWDAPEVVVEYLRTGDEALRDAAWDAAWAAWAARAAEAAASDAAKAKQRRRFTRMVTAAFEAAS